eukprot:5759069-Alexandrium_andersonii.AAC.1
MLALQPAAERPWPPAACGPASQGRRAQRRPVGRARGGGSADRTPRAWFKGRASLGRAFRPDGSLTEGRAETLDVLRQSRREVRGAGWAESDAPRALLDARGHGPTPGLEEARPRRGQLQAAASRAGGSAPSADGIPHKLFHCGVEFVAQLLGQAFHASTIGNEA